MNFLPNMQPNLALNTIMDFTEPVNMLPIEAFSDINPSFHEIWIVRAPKSFNGALLKDISFSNKELKSNDGERTNKVLSVVGTSPEPRFEVQKCATKDAESLQWVPLFAGSNDGELSISEIPVTRQFNVVECFGDDEQVYPPSVAPTDWELPPVEQVKDLNGKFTPVGYTESFIDDRSAVSKKSKKRKRDVKQSNVDSKDEGIQQSSAVKKKKKKSKKGNSTSA